MNCGTVQKMKEPEMEYQMSKRKYFITTSKRNEFLLGKLKYLGQTSWAFVQNANKHIVQRGKNCSAYIVLYHTIGPCHLLPLSIYTATYTKKY